VYYSDGAMDVTGAVELFANRSAREISSIRMTGNYGSEILRGNVAFRPNNSDLTGFEHSFARNIENAAKTFADEAAVPRTSFIAFRQLPWHHYGRRSIEQSQLTVRSPYLDNELVQLAFQAPNGAAVNKAITHRLIRESSPELFNIPTDRGDMAKNSGRLRSFWQELLPRAEYLFDYGMPPWLAKVDRACKALHLERFFLGRQKFQHFRIWYRDQLSSYVKAMLLDPRTLGRDYINRRDLERMVTGHLKGTSNHTLSIHKLLSIELVQRRLISGS
jgi:asparagine synthase (glutamine-hydrolysing)